MSDAPRSRGDDEQPTRMPGGARADDRVGPYHLRDKIGEGGMGEIWLAEQSQPVRRTVALKVIKQGMDTRQVVARFEAERQALAMMEHPAIAKVYDAGATPDGRPYFVMEHVRGLPITEHCDRGKLSNRERLELFVLVCEGVQHAHHKAVIHRDLKPSNVLVTVRDGKAVPKIIDFGVAKATGQRLTDKTMHTRLGTMIGTPFYMSPEQAEMSGEDVDTRTDVYALGVMLYELLVGALPFDRDELLRASFEAMVRKIRDEDSPRPSARLAMLGEISTESARRRRTELPALKRELSGDLDWITMKALEKDRTRRYGSPQALADDIRRYLTDQPVLAGPPSARYRARKFVKRHTAGVVAAVAALVVLVAFAATMAVQRSRIAAERDRANAEATRANREAEARGEVSRFLKDLFTTMEPEEARNHQLTARQLLDRGARRIEDTLTEQPELRAELMGTVGDVYRKLGLHAEAQPLLERALAERRRLQGTEHPDTLASMNDLAILYTIQARYDQAEPLFLACLAGRKRVLGAEHLDTLDVMNNLAVLYRRQHRYDDAERLLVETLGLRRRLFGEDHHKTLNSANNLANLYWTQGRYDEARPLYVETLEVRRRTLGDDHPETLRSLNNLGLLLAQIDRYDEAEPLYVETLETKRRVLGAEHPETLESMNNLGELYWSQGRYDEAEPLFVETLAARKEVLGRDHPDTLGSMNNLGELYRSQGQHDRAEAVLLDTLATKRRVLGGEDPATASALHSLGCLYRDQGRHDEAQRMFRQAHDIWVVTKGPDHPDVAENLEEWAGLRRAMDDAEGADRLLARARRIRED